MPLNIKYPEHLVFGLDIGTRSIVGTVGYKDGKVFKVVAQVSHFHETRAMLDGQIHDINNVSETIQKIKYELEEKIGRPLTDVCIAAAGRVLKTVTVKVDQELPNEAIIDEEQIHSLNLMAVEKAYDTLRAEMNEKDIKFYCVGYTVIRYFLNDYAILNLMGQKGARVGTELIATFLPEEVIDGLYAAVQKAGLYVANLTLEPIAAINVAIPENYRLLNLALLDVGAGTSDICITKDGSIIAYGMMPFAGDEITEKIAKSYLVDFKTAETIKIACLKKKSITYKDIMGISHKLSTKDVIDQVSDTVQMITRKIADKIMELNGGKSVSAVFVVGGGGKIPGFVDHLAEYLSIPKERVALRGQEVLQDVEYLEEGIKKDSTLVTPIGICLNFYEQKNNFIFVQVNGQRVKLYDNNKLTIADVALQIGLPNEQIFPKRGKELVFYLDGEKRMVRGQLGEASIVKLNGKPAGISSIIEQNDIIEIVSSTTGEDAILEVNQLSECKQTISFLFNGNKVVCPKFILVNGKLVSGYYQIQNDDKLVTLDYYTVEQVLTFMDLPYSNEIYVNNQLASLHDEVYDNFTIRYEEELKSTVIEENDEEADVLPNEAEQEFVVASSQDQITKDDSQQVTVNGVTVTLKGKEKYILVDVLDFYPFDLSVAKGSRLITRINQQNADFTTSLCNGDYVELYWEE